MSSDESPTYTDPMSSVAEGVMKGFLSWTKEELKGIIEKYQNRGLLFIGDRETIRNLKEQEKTAEWQVYCQYVKDKKLRMLIKMGLTLRKLSDSDETKLHNLRTKIRSNYTVEGLHVAQFIETNTFGKYFGIILSKGETNEELQQHIEETLNNIDKYTEFIQTGDNIEKISLAITTRINANLPSTFILFGKKSAIETAKQIQANVINSLIEYSVEVNESEKDYICFFNRRIRDYLSDKNIKSKQDILR